MLNSDLCDYSDIYTAAKGNIVVKTENGRVIDGWNRNLILKNNAPFLKCISKTSNVFIANTKDLYIVQLDWVQQKLFKDIWYLMELYKRYFSWFFNKF